MLQSKNTKLKEASCRQCGKRARPHSNYDGATGWIFNLGSCKCPSTESRPVKGYEQNGGAECNSTKVPLEEEPIPTEIDGQFEVIAVLGKGGMGTVYKVRNNETNTVLALKLIHASLSKDAAAVKRFEQEAQAVAQLDHPNLVAVYGHGKTKSGEPYLLMDFVEGESLSHVIECDGALDEPRAIEIFSQICAALSHAHEQNLVHRDIKPANIILSKTDDGEEIARVVDFGIAKTLPSDDRETRDLTQTGEVFGSPHYMSPEQCLGFMLDQRSDIYSFGCLMYEALSGKPPFAGSNPIQLVVKHINDVPKPFLQQLNATARMKGLQSIILTCLEKEQVDRWQSVDEIFDAITKVRIGKSAYSFHSARKNSQVVKSMLPFSWMMPGIVAFFGVFHLVMKAFKESIPMLPSVSLYFPFFCLLFLPYVLLRMAHQLSRISTEGKVPRLNAWSINSMVFSGFVFLGAIPLVVSMLFYPDQPLDAAKLKLTLPFMDLFSLFGGLFSVISIAATFVCAVGVFVDRGPKKISVGSITPRILLSASILVLLYPVMFPRPSASLSASVASGISFMPAEISSGVASHLITYAESRDPNNRSILEAGLTVSSRAKNYAEVARYCGELLKLPNLEKWTVDRYASRRAEAYEKLGRFDQAIAYYTEEIALDPDAYISYERRANCLMKVKQFDRVIADCNEIIELRPGYPNPFYVRAKAFLAKGLPDSAIDSINARLSQRGGQTAAAYLFKSYVLEQMGDTSAARKELSLAANFKIRRTIEPFTYPVARSITYPATYLTHLIKALAFHRLGQEKEAAAQIEESKFNPMNADTFENDIEFLPEALREQLKKLLVDHGINLRT